MNCLFSPAVKVDRAPTKFCHMPGPLAFRHAFYPLQKAHAAEYIEREGVDLR
jgi:hypothetical protein